MQRLHPLPSDLILAPRGTKGQGGCWWLPRSQRSDPRAFHVPPGRAGAGRQHAAVCL